MIFRERGEGREEEWERNTDVRETLSDCLLLSSNGGPGPQPRHVSWQGTEPAAFWFAGSAQSTEPHQPGPYLLLSSENLQFYTVNKQSPRSSTWLS